LCLQAGRQEGHPACKKLSGGGAGMVICLERGADLHMTQLMPQPHTVSCFSKIQTGFTFLVLAHPASPGKGAAKQVFVCGRTQIIKKITKETESEHSFQQPGELKIIKLILHADHPLTTQI